MSVMSATGELSVPVSPGPKPCGQAPPRTPAMECWINGVLDRAGTSSQLPTIYISSQFPIQ